MGVSSLITPHRSHPLQLRLSSSTPSPMRSSVGRTCPATALSPSPMRSGSHQLICAHVQRQKDSFPLHYIVFKQTAVHIPHEANAEQVFSTAGRLASAHTDPRHLARMVMIARNKKIYKPESKNILSKYFQKFSKAGKLEFEEGTLGLELDGIQECDEE